MPSISKHIKGLFSFFTIPFWHELAVWIFTPARPSRRPGDRACEPRDVEGSDGQRLAWDLQDPGMGLQGSLNYRQDVSQDCMQERRKEKRGVQSSQEKQNKHIDF